MTVLITGSLGFVGSATVANFADQGVHWLGYDIMCGQDIRDFAQLDKFVEQHKPSRILHLAAIARFADADKDPKLAHETNVIGTANVVRVASKYHIPTVYASTGSVYMPIKRPPPITEDFEVAGNSVYGCTKLLGELYVRECRAPWIILRYAHLYGKEKRMHGLIGGFLERINRGLAPVLYGGKQSNDFTYIKDVARANRLALEAPWDKWNRVYNIGSGEELTAEQAGAVVCGVFGYDGNIEVKDGRTVDPERFVFDCSLADQFLRFKAGYSFMDGLIDMREQGDENSR
jgi:nucleoside-diphosphate-sugar epimerase